MTGKRCDKSIERSIAGTDDRASRPRKGTSGMVRYLERKEGNLTTVPVGGPDGARYLGFAAVYYRYGPLWPQALKGRGHPGAAGTRDWQARR